MMDQYDADGIVSAQGNSEQDIRNEIVFLERRLSEMTTADDSASEKLLARAYCQLSCRARRFRRIAIPPDFCYPQPPFGRGCARA
ncbi:MAG: hypothetical protein AMJ68_02490 [Acidithiobacillales bacterium SG8_45]|jgi:hypothetical protein|nr:MAG: hypothetical protein AMJ68_02490 [Acidithiobacillales bacterium SG8_45]